MLVAVGGGGLISGVAAWFGGRVKVVGVEPGGLARAARRAGGGPAGGSRRSIHRRRIRSAHAGSAHSASISAGAHVAEVALVSDDAIRAAQRTLWSDFNMIAEPGGAAAYAALASGAYVPAAGERVGVLVCGANADLAAFSA